MRASAPTGKVYEYRIVNAPIVSPFLLPIRLARAQPLDVDAMRRARRCLVGRARFRGLPGCGVRGPSRPSGRIRVDRMGRRRRATIVPLVMRHRRRTGFLRHMVRNIVGTLVDVGAGPMAAVRRRATSWPPATARGRAAPRRRRVCFWCGRCLLTAATRFSCTMQRANVATCSAPVTACIIKV